MLSKLRFFLKSRKRTQASDMVEGEPSSYIVGTQTRPLLTFPPLQQPHKQTFVLLHGSGDVASSFGTMLLYTSFDDPDAPAPQPPETAADDDGKHLGERIHLRDVYPHAKFIFPTAAIRPMKRYNGEAITRWFDWWSLEETDVQQDIQRDGLRESAKAILEIVRDECSAVGSENVVLGGLSNGCGQTLATALLLGKRLKLGAIIGMCGWLPYAPELLQKDYTLDQAREWLVKEIGWEETEVPSDEDKMRGLPPVFLGHGDDDWTVPPERCPEAEGILKGLGFDVEKQTYPGLGHWYSPEMLKDIVVWLKERVPTRKKR